MSIHIIYTNAYFIKPIIVQNAYSKEWYQRETYSDADVFDADIQDAYIFKRDIVLKAFDFTEADTEAFWDMDILDVMSNN